MKDDEVKLWFEQNHFHYMGMKLNEIHDKD